MKQIQIIFNFVACVFVAYSLRKLFISEQDNAPLFLGNFSSDPFANSIFDYILQPRLERNVFSFPESFMTTKEIIKSRGYPLEVHEVVTEDGYILELHRIPYGLKMKGNTSIKRRPVFLLHGMMSTDHYWLMNPSNLSLAYILADQGFDVWLGNNRGNTYSRKHTTLDPEKDAQYWNYSWDEMGKYDVTASVNFVINVTKQEKLAAFFAYSLGSALFFIGAIENPSLNDKVEVMIALGPAVSMANLKNYFRFLAYFIKPYQLLHEIMGTRACHANDGLTHRLLRLVCETNYLGVNFCNYLVSQVFGYSNNPPDETIMFVLAGHYPAGGSVNTMLQLLQNYNSGEGFRYFDFGDTGNLLRYGFAQPPEYNLSKVHVPVYIAGAELDPFAPPEDVLWLKSRLANVKEFYTYQGFSHGDLVWSSRAFELVYRPILDSLLPPTQNNTPN